MKILSIAAHYGGGVGSVVRAWLKYDKSNTHTLAYLKDIPKNKAPDASLFSIDMIPKHDIIIVHVWNTPELFQFLTRNDIPPCRMIGWSHMAGNHPPYVLSDKLKDFFDDFYYTSPVSGHDHEYIWSSCDIKKFSEIKKKKHPGFNIGYVGTMDYSKLHREFINICSHILIPDAHFTIIGHGCDLQNMIDEVESRQLSTQFTFTGQIKDIIPYIETMDVFLYPLSRTHEGTCEQVLGEMMASGTPCIALNNEAEKYIIKHRVTGYLCNSEISILHSILGIYHKKEPELSNICQNAQVSALHRYSTEKTVNSWNDAFMKIMQKPKKLRLWGKYKHLFLESLGHYAGQFIENPQGLMSQNIYHWRSENKGSIKQYLSCFPHDRKLKKWAKLL